MTNNDFPCFIFSVSEEGFVIELNQHMGEVLGYTLSEVIGKLRFEELLTGGSKIFYKTHFTPILMIEGRSDEMFLTFRSKSGKEFPVLMNMTVITHNGTREIRAAGLRIARRNKFEKELIEAKKAAEKALAENVLLNQLKSQLEVSQTSLESQISELRRKNEEHVAFSNILAHDLQEPLRKLQVFTSRMVEKGTQEIGVNSRPYLTKIHSISEYAHKLLIRLQGYHSLEISLNDFKMASIASMVDRAISNQGLQTIALNFEELEVKEVYGDFAKLALLFEELIHNSYKYRSPERILSIKISSNIVKDNYYQALDDSYRFVDFIRIKMEDNSSGFPCHAQENIFKPLQKYHAQSGTGLGLAYSKKIVELHKGKITMKSVKGGGSEFIILLPTKETP